MLKYGAIAGGEKSTVDAAFQILENGGNAFDAAVGAVFTSMVSEYTLTGAGGGGAFLACPVNSEPTLYDFFVDTPPPQKEKDLDFFGILVDFGSSQQEFHIGQGSVAIPGNTAGLLKVHGRLGQLPLKTVLEPSIAAARSGVIINKAQAYLIKILEPILTHSHPGLDLFRPNGELLNHGDRFQNPAFADFLEILVNEGDRYFYQGDGAELILKTIGEKGVITGVKSDGLDIDWDGDWLALPANPDNFELVEVYLQFQSIRFDMIVELELTLDQLHRLTFMRLAACLLSPSLKPKTASV